MTIVIIWEALAFKPWNKTYEMMFKNRRQKGKASNLPLW